MKPGVPLHESGTQAQVLKHGLAAGADAAPPSPDWTISQGWDHYTRADHAIWETLFTRQSALLPRRACQEFMDGLADLHLRADKIPDFEDLNAVLMPRTGWQVVAVPGLVPDEVFFDHLAHRRFPSGNFIRRADQLDYLEEPDVFHDVFGHVPMLLNPVMADFIQAYGVGGQRAKDLGCLPLLARVYWYTVEFGLVQQSDGLRIYGAGIVSSASETLFALEDDSPHRIAFDLPRVMQTGYRIDDFQETYFVLQDLRQLLQLADTDFEPLYRRLQALPELAPSSHRVAGDVVLHAGTGRYHHPRR
jgi:phenylalanine-4-hydroxylase